MLWLRYDSTKFRLSYSATGGCVYLVAQVTHVTHVTHVVQVVQLSAERLSHVTGSPIASGGGATRSIHIDNPSNTSSPRDCAIAACAHRVRSSSELVPTFSSMVTPRFPFLILTNRVVIVSLHFWDVQSATLPYRRCRLSLVTMERPTTESQ